jgi:hypothetical protein
MITAHFLVAGEEREVREVEADWLESAQKNQDNVLLTDGNTYRIQNVQTTGDGHARVELVAPQFSRGS